MDEGLFKGTRNKCPSISVGLSIRWPIQKRPESIRDPGNIHVSWRPRRPRTLGTSRTSINFLGMLYELFQVLEWRNVCRRVIDFRLTNAAVALARGGFRVKRTVEPSNVFVDMILELEGTGAREATLAV